MYATDIVTFLVFWEEWQSSAKRTRRYWCCTIPSSQGRMVGRKGLFLFCLPAVQDCPIFPRYSYSCCRARDRFTSRYLLRAQPRPPPSVKQDISAFIKANLRNVGLSHVYAGSHQVSATAAEDKQNYMAMRDCRSLRCVLSSATPRSANSQRAHRIKCGMPSRRLSHQNECY